MKKTKSPFEAAYHAEFKKQANGVQFDVFDLGRVRDCVRKSVEAGTSIVQAMDTAITLYRKN